MPYNMLTGELPTTPNERPVNPMDDNVILTDNHRIARQRTNFQTHLNTYINQAAILIVSFMENAARICANTDSAVTLNIGHFVNLKQIETYWDFPNNDPIAAVHQVEPDFRSLGVDTQRRLYRNVVSQTQTLGNVPVLSTRLMTGLTAKLYPKTNRRLRLELTHDLRHCTALTTRHTFDGEDAMHRLVQLIGRCAEHASEEAQILAELLRPQELQDVEQYSPYRLVREIIRATNSPSEQDLLLSILINQGSYRHRPNDPLLAAVRQLTRRRVLERVRPYYPTLRLTPRYQRARQVLADHDTDGD